MFGDLIFRQLFDTTSSTYTYLLADPSSRQAVIIDTVFEQHLRDLALIEELGLTLITAIDTHCHADHVTGLWLMQQATGCRIGISRLYGDTVQGADWRLDHGERVFFGKRYLEVRATPGHTNGCLTYVCDDQRMASGSSATRRPQDPPSKRIEPGATLFTRMPSRTHATASAGYTVQCFGASATSLV